MSGIINCHLSLRACYQSIACLLHHSWGPHTRCTVAAKQRTVAYLSGSGRCFCRRLLITVVTPVHRPDSANAAASVCLYVGDKKGHCWSRHQMCRPPVMSADHLATYYGGPVDLAYPASGRRLCPLLHSQPVFWHVHHGTGDRADARCFACPSARNVNRLSSSVRQRGIPPPVVRGPIGHCASLVALLWPEFTFRARHCPLSIDRSHTVMGPGILG